MTPTLLLNADAQPISFLPISAISWQEAVRLIYLDAVTVLHNYEDWPVHSPSVTMQVPAVLMLKRHVIGRGWQIATGPQRSLIYLRDLYRCAYCDQQFHRRQLTLDHVLPRKFGGRSQWTNLVACCEPCNRDRGCDVRIQPKVKPFRPSYGLLIKHMRQFPLVVPHPSWNDYLLWPDDRVRFSAPSHRIEHEHFDTGIRLHLECFT